MKNLIIIFLLTASSAMGCKSTKNAQTDPMTEQEEKAALRKKPIQETAVHKVDIDEEIAESDGKKEPQERRLSVDSLIARIERTPCYGTCPVYTLSVYNTGFVTYEGENFVENKGFYGAYVSRNVLSTLQHMAQEIGFAELQDRYDNEGITDIPSTITTVRLNGKLKTVVNRDGGPEKLQQFQDFFDSLFTDVKWDDKYENPEAE